MARRGNDDNHESVSNIDPSFPFFRGRQIMDDKKIGINVFEQRRRRDTLDMGDGETVKRNRKNSRPQEAVIRVGWYPHS